MMRIKTRRLLWQSFRLAGADKIMGAYFAFFLLVSLFLFLAEPGIRSFPDAMWYCFAVATTVGFGDITAMSMAGRTLTVILSIYSIGIVAIFTAVITSFFMELAKAKAQESAKEFLDELERLPELSKEELRELSDRVKRFTSSGSFS